MLAIKEFVLKHLLKIGIGVIAIIIIMYTIHLIKESGRLEERVDVQEQTQQNTNEHIEIEEGQNAIRNHSIDDTELLNSLRTNSF